MGILIGIDLHHIQSRCDNVVSRRSCPFLHTVNLVKFPTLLLATKVQRKRKLSSVYLMFAHMLYLSLCNDETFNNDINETADVGTEQNLCLLLIPGIPVGTSNCWIGLLWQIMETFATKFNQQLQKVWMSK